MPSCHKQCMVAAPRHDLLRCQKRQCSEQRTDKGARTCPVPFQLRRSALQSQLQPQLRCAALQVHWQLWHAALRCIAARHGLTHVSHYGRACAFGRRSRRLCGIAATASTIRSGTLKSLPRTWRLTLHIALASCKLALGLTPAVCAGVKLTRASARRHAARSGAGMRSCCLSLIALAPCLVIEEAAADDANNDENRADWDVDGGRHGAQFELASRLCLSPGRVSNEASSTCMHGTREVQRRERQGMGWCRCCLTPAVTVTVSAVAGKLESCSIDSKNAFAAQLRYTNHN